MAYPATRIGCERDNQFWDSMMMLDREDMEISYMNSVSSLSEDETPIILSMKKPSKYDKGLINRKMGKQKKGIKGKRKIKHRKTIKSKIERTGDANKFNAILTLNKKFNNTFEERK